MSISVNRLDVNRVADTRDNRSDLVLGMDVDSEWIKAAAFLPGELPEEMTEEVETFVELAHTYKRRKER
ncbi:MAG TPA: hypothetical protein PKW76_05955 [bacterium]|nr:hypothetical protein [bacterium]HPM97449.1 hypothetical protein [bacterium]